MALANVGAVHYVCLMTPRLRADVSDECPEMGLDWLAEIPERVTAYLDRLAVPDRWGEFLPCLKGPTEDGRRARLGFSCFALKVFYTTGTWGRLPEASRQQWIRFLQSHQVVKRSRRRFWRNAFADQAIMEYLDARTSWGHRLKAQWLFPRFMTMTHRAVMGESKQAICTLLQVGAQPVKLYRPYPTTARGLRIYLSRLDWSKPWAAGGQASALATLVKTQEVGNGDEWASESLTKTCATFFESLADPKTGGYFSGPTPEHDHLINGAMKVLTALDWLDVRIHFPERLIDTCLARLPRHEGCHLVDAIYVLYRCARDTSYKRAQVRRYSEDVLEMVRHHYNGDGGFSYNIRSSQTSYYGVPISKGLDESDIHGTCLLTWAVAMVQELLELPYPRLEVIQP